ncbi:MAG: GNAT family N-acetyltransferase [Bacteroidota bacterium]
MSQGEIILRPASPNDISILRHWDEQPHVLASGAEDWEWETELYRDPPWREYLIAELDGQAIGFVAIIDPAEEETHYWGDVPSNLRAIDIWIGEVEMLGKGYGTQMMAIALQKCFAPPEVTAVLIDPLLSNTRAHKFYEGLGFRFVREQSFEEDDCYVYELSREDWAFREAGRKNC